MGLGKLFKKIGKLAKESPELAAVVIYAGAPVLAKVAPKVIPKAVPIVKAVLKATKKPSAT